MNTLQIEKELLPIWELLSSSVKPFYIQARERGLHMELLVESDSMSSFLIEADEEAAVVQQSAFDTLLVVGDPIRLAQVFRNLISNALKFSYPDTTVFIKANWHADQLLDAGLYPVCNYYYLFFADAAYPRREEDGERRGQYELTCACWIHSHICRRQRTRFPYTV